MGPDFHWDDVRSDADKLLHSQVSAWSRGSWFLPGCHLLFKSVVSEQTIRAGHCKLHVRNPGHRSNRWTFIGRLLSLNGMHGLTGWQWLFLVEGLPAIILGLVVLFYLTDRPATAHWLTSAERETLVAQLEAEREACPSHAAGVIAALSNRTIWQLGIIFLLSAMGFYGYSFWSPLLVKSLTGTTNFGVGLILAAISAATIVCMLVNGAHSDHTDERVLHTRYSVVCHGNRISWLRFTS